MISLPNVHYAYFSFLCIMEEKYLYQLAEFALPSDVLHYVSIVKIESDSSLLRIYPDEKMEKERLR